MLERNEMNVAQWTNNEEPPLFITALADGTKTG